MSRPDNPWISPCGNGACIEIQRGAPSGVHSGGVWIRSACTPHGFETHATDHEWRDFLAAVKAGKLDHVVEPQEQAT